MEMISVSSSAIAAIGYDEATMRMQIRFNGGQTYTFCRVPLIVFNGLLRAPSKGGYYDTHIKGQYSC